MTTLDIDAQPAAEVERAALDVIGLSVAYGGVNAVDQVTFAVAPGSILGLIGPNGAGKTTVFDAICGLVPLVQGRLVLGGRDITEMTTARRARAGLGRSFQDARLFSALTVAETLSCAFERHIRAQDVVSTAIGAPWVLRTERRIRRRVEGLIELMGLGAFRDKFISELSTGSRRIVDLACVLAHDPTVVLLDEPSSGIAQKETEALGPLLLQVKANTNCTMLLIEHDMPLVTSVSDELIALEIGRVIVRGPPLVVTNHPQVVEAYLGTDQRIVARSGSDLDGDPAADLRPRSTTTTPARAARAGKAAKSAKPTDPARSPAPAPVKRATAVKRATPVKRVTPAAGSSAAGGRSADAPVSKGARRTRRPDQ